MYKLSSAVFVFVFGVFFLLSGCSTYESKVSVGVNNMLDTAHQLSKAIDNGDQAEVKKVGPKLEDQWSTFEDDVKKDNKGLYGKIEKYLDPTVAGSQAPSLDKKALGTLNSQLTAALKELADKAK